MEKINGYTLLGELCNANSGFSKWGFASKNGREYFIKELISPVYPMDESAMSKIMLEQRRSSCKQFEGRMCHIFERINGASRGNLVRVIDFFRCQSRYYVVTEKVSATSPSVKDIASQPENIRLMLMKTLAHCFFDLHGAGLVHFDVKPSNVLIRRTLSGNLCAKLIDFDSGFIIGEPMEEKELGGDLTYIAPETFLAMIGRDAVPDEKADIFALGIVFHEYFCGDIPQFDKSEYEYPYEVLLNGDKLTLKSEDMPESFVELLNAMLDVDPEKRPTAKQVVVALHKLTYKKPPLPPLNYLALTFNSRYTKWICLSKDKITYRNIVPPAFNFETRDFPSDFFVQKNRDITKEEYTSIVEALCEAGLFSIVQPYNPADPRFNGSLQTITCMCDGGNPQGYVAAQFTDPRFIKIVSILEEYCDFEKIQPEWYANPSDYRPEPETPSAPPIPKPVAPPAPPVTASPEKPTPVAAPLPHKFNVYEPARPWFNTAGDL